MAEANKKHISLVVTGHVDAGKSSTSGHLIFKLGGINEREMAKLQKEADEKGKSSFAFAYYMDTCKEERERGVTIQCTTKEFFTDKYHYSIVDAPGHKNYIKNMITGAGCADAALILVPAEKGGFEAAIAKADPKMGIEEGQTRQHARLLYLLGIEQIIVGVNKMDSCDWSEIRFNEIRDEFVKMITQIGFKPKKVPIIPYSGFYGDNLVVKSDKSPWYKGWTANLNKDTTIKGWTILDALNDLVVPPKRLPDAPLRLPISGIYNIKGVGTIYCGRVEQGTVRPGDIVGFAQTGLKGKKVFQIEQHHKQLSSAGPGEVIGMAIKGINKDDLVETGDVMYIEKENTLKPTKAFTAMVFVQEHPGILKVGYTPIIFCRTQKVACKMTKINWKQSKKTGNEKIMNPENLEQFESAEVVFEPMASMYVEGFDTCQGLSRVAVMDSNRLKMLGKVISVEAKTD